MGRYPGARVRHLHHTPRAGGRMRESSPHGLTERRRAILRQASAALRGRLVTLWRERRGPERLTLELVGLSLGALERLWTAADQATVYLCAALDVLDGCLWHVREATGLSIVTRAHLLADLAAVATAIDDVLSPSA